MVGAKYDPTGAAKGVYDAPASAVPEIEQLTIEQFEPERESEVLTVGEAREESSAPTSTARDYGLDAKTAAVFEAIPCKSPVSVDRIICDGLSTADIITALTMLEIMGLVSSLPGGVYIRK